MGFGTVGQLTCHVLADGVHDAGHVADGVVAGGGQAVAGVLGLDLAVQLIVGVGDGVAERTSGSMVADTLPTAS